MRSKYFSKLLILNLIWLGLCALPLRAEGVAGERPPTHLKAMTFSENPGRTTIDILADRALDYTSYYPNPRLFILDVMGAESSLEKNFVDFKTAQVEFANVTVIGEGQKPMVRIEFNLVQPIQYALQADRGKLRLVFSSPIPAASQSPTANPAVPKAGGNADISRGSKAPLRDVSIVEDEQELTLNLQTTSKPEFQAFELESPNRIVVDVTGSEFKVSHQSLRLRTDLIQKIRFGFGESQQGKLVRCVFDVSRKSPYTIEASDSGLVVRFHKQTTAASRQPSKPVEKPSESAALANLDHQAPESGILAPNGQWAARSQAIGTLQFAEVEKVAMPEPLASPAVALEGPISLAEVEPKNLPVQPAVVNSEPQVTEALPPREPESAPAVTAAVPVPESTQGNGSSSSVAESASPLRRSLNQVKEIKIASASEPTGCFCKSSAGAGSGTRFDACTARQHGEAHGQLQSECAGAVD
ncbi:MAG: AMIN domain-containing protein [Terriglobia bacterium]